jgi:hypothetical protein
MKAAFLSIRRGGGRLALNVGRLSLVLTLTTWWLREPTVAAWSAGPGRTHAWRLGPVCLMWRGGRPYDARR